jgi:hypothetical protein
LCDYNSGSDIVSDIVCAIVYAIVFAIFGFAIVFAIFGFAIFDAIGFADHVFAIFDAIFDAIGFADHVSGSECIAIGRSTKHELHECAVGFGCSSNVRYRYRPGELRVNATPQWLPFQHLC